MTRSRTLPETEQTARKTAGFWRYSVKGGNLSMIATTMGTSLEIDADGIILFIEDINEPLYRIDRLLTHLCLAGKLSRLRVDNEA